MWPHPDEVRRALVSIVAPFAVTFLFGAAAGAVVTLATLRGWR